MARTLRALLAGALCLSLMMGAEAFGTSRSCLSSRPAAAFAKEVLRNGPTVPPSNFKVAFIGDQGISDTAKAVLQKIKEKKVDIVIHAGDFDYDNDPKGWDDQLNEVLGPDFPYFASIGNHDSLRWGLPRGYQWHLEQRMERINASSFCTGETGVKYACNYNGFLFALSGVGSRQLDHPDFIDDVFDGALNPWRAVAWHKNQRLFQVGGKINEVGYGVYEAGRRNGAIICTAHEHSYSRTHLMADFSEQVIASTDPKMTLTEGKSFSFVTGLGGRGIREYKWGLQDNPWWASTGSSDDGIGHGALICTFNLNGNAREAECELEDSNNVVWDRFSLSSNVTGVSLKPTCVGEMKAFSVENPLEDIQELPASASRKESTPFVFVNEKLLTLGGEGHAAFRFHLEGVKVPLIDSIRFQIYGMESGEGGQPITIRGLKRFPEAGELISSVPMTESHVVWEEEDEDWEQGTVWVSPDLHEIVKELLAENTAEKDFSLSFVVSGPGQRVIASSDLDPCLAPSLLVELKKDC